MKSNTFNYSLLAVGVAAVMGISTGAMAAVESGNAGTNSKTVTNTATASYNVGGIPQEAVKSNTVTVNINEVISFSLSADNPDGDITDNTNSSAKVVPEGIVEFQHTITNTGNLDDTYSYSITDSSSGKYDLTNSTATYIIYNSDKSVAKASTTTSVPSGNFDLKAGQYVVVTLNAKTTGNKGGETQNLQFSATSTKITANPNSATPTLANIDASSTFLPVFSIAKTITSGTFDVNTPNAEVTYQVIVRNVNLTYSKDATNVTITDFLPDGLVMTAPLTSANITTSGNATINSGSIVNTSSDKGFSFIAATLPKDGAITITFKAKKETGVDLAQNALNHVSVSDNLNEGVGADNILVDSTDTTKQSNIKFYPTNGDKNITDGTAVADGTNGDDSTQPLNSTQRNLTLTNPQTIQIPTTTNAITQANHSVTITNTGRDTESNLTFTLTESDTADNVSVSNVQINGTGTVLTANAGVYTIPGTLAAGASLNITYVVTSTNAKVGQEEKTTVTLVPSATPGNSPTVAPVIDQTLIRGIKLDKKQVLDKGCNGSYTGTFGSTTFTVNAGECVVYNVEATNTFDSAVLGSRDITNILISDDLTRNGIAANADYLLGTVNNKNISGALTTGTVAAPSAANILVASNDVGTLAPQAKANLQFAVKIKQN